MRFVKLITVAKAHIRGEGFSPVVCKNRKWWVWGGRVCLSARLSPITDGLAYTPTGRYCSIYYSCLPISHLCSRLLLIRQGKHLPVTAPLSVLRVLRLSWVDSTAVFADGILCHNGYCYLCAAALVQSCVA